MKKLLIVMTGATVLTFSACKSSQVSSFDDDIYRDPVQEQQIAREKAEARAKAEAEARQKAEQEALARKDAEDNNPWYKDPQESADDYYDYKYASRLNRFSNPIPGAGYYDSRYTNYYTYTQNPMLYGSSIYSSYNWMPSGQFSNYSTGISLVFGSGYGYSPYYSGFYGQTGYPMYNDPFMYGYGVGYASPWMGVGYGYSPFGYYDPWAYNAGYYNGFYNGYYSGWGYYNSFDANSGYANMTYAPRGSNTGGNAPRGGASGARMMGGERENFIQSVREQQNNTPRFSETPRARHASSAPAYSGNPNVNTANPRQERGQGNSQPQHVDPNASNSNQESRSRRDRGESRSGGFESGSYGGRSSGAGGNSSSPRGGGSGGGGNRPR